MEVSPVSSSNTPVPKKFFHSRAFFFGVLVFSALVFFVGTFLVYVRQSRDPFSRVFVRIVPLPVAFVSTHPILYRDYYRQLDALEKYAKSQAEYGLPLIDVPSNADLPKVVLGRMVKSQVTVLVARRYGVKVRSQDIDAEFDRFLSLQNETMESVTTSLANYYGWSVDEFKRYIIRDYLIRQRLTLVLVQDDTIDRDKRKEAEDILTEVKEGKRSFEDIAKEKSEDASTASLGGDLGFFKLDSMVPEFADAVKKLSVGQVSDVVRTEFGFHIIKLDQIIPGPNGTPEDAQYAARHILILATPLSDFIDARIKETHVWRLWR